MPETGKHCIVCGKKHYLKDLDSTGVCNHCKKESNEDDNMQQYNLSIKFSRGDNSVDICKCGRYFTCERQRSNKEIEVFEECSLCRITKEYGMQELGEHQKVLKKEKQESEHIESDQKLKQETMSARERNIMRVKSLEKKRELGSLNTIKKQKNSVINIKENTEEKTGRVTMSTTENYIESNESTDLELYEQEELEETHSMATVNLSNNLRQENSGSINLLTESATLLTTSAKSFLKDYKGDFGDEPIRTPTASEAEMALKLALGANEIMKTKLEYIKTGRTLINDMYEVLEDQ